MAKLLKLHASGPAELEGIGEQLVLELESGHRIHLMHTQFGLEVTLTSTPPGQDRVCLGVVMHGPKRFDLRIVDR